MTLPEKVKELLEQLTSEHQCDIAWRGIIDDKEWKILLHKDANETLHVTVKQRGLKQ
jgi:hypothetical protein